MYTDPEDKNNFAEFAIGSDGQVVTQISGSDDIGDESKEDLIKEKQGDLDCEENAECIVEQAVDTYLDVDMALPGENEA